MAITPIILQSGLSLLLIVPECNVVGSLLVYITWSLEDIVQRLFSISVLMMGPIKCSRSAFTPPEVWCAKTAEELKSFPVDYNLLSPDIYSALSGPDEGVKFVDSLIANEDNKNNNSTPLNASKF